MTHYYKDKEWSKPGVTSIIADCHDKSGPLTQWAANMVVEWIRQNCPKALFLDMGHLEKSSDEFCVSEEDLDEARFNYKSISEKALNIGSEVHSAIENWLKFKKEPITPHDEIKAGFKAFIEFYNDNKMEPFALEQSVIGDYWGGTLDYYGLFNNKFYVIDFKTSKYHYPNEHGPQIAAYRSEVKGPCEGCGILRLDKETGKPDFKDYSKRYEKDLKHFQLMVPLYMHRHPIIAKNAGWKP